jgi:hypothetical protein
VGLKLDGHYCIHILTSYKHSTSLAILRVFEDPGIDFFDLENEDLVVIEKFGGARIAILYFKFNNNVYDLVKQNISFPSDFFYPSPVLPTNLHHRRIIIHCLRVLTNIAPRSTRGVQYAATYWAQHLSKTDIAGDILAELQCIELGYMTPGRRITVADVDMVIQWLGVRHIFCLFFIYGLMEGIALIECGFPDETG